MANIKTAISIPEHLFEKVEILSRKSHISRSRLFALAVQDFIERSEDEELLEAINTVYDDQPNPEERIYRQKMRQKHRRLVEGLW